MTTISRERIEQYANDPRMCNVNDEIRQIARIALASLEAKPIGAFHIAEQQVDGTSDYLKDGEWPIDNGTIEVYATPPAPDVPAVLERLRSIVADPRALPRRKEWVSGQQYSYVLLENVEAMVDEACRAAMRKAGNSPVTPDGWISCSERMPDDGQHVIILCDGAFVLYAQYRDGEFFDIVRNGDEFFETQSRNVTDWMRLPEPPQG
ncbi:DUF551 domain-containing protein [Escherichia coli]|nr:DUF551 domain-containing protein [Escherichia coli]ELH6405656.1 DUF551 domain-containing protein [Escherichia coli]